jgi:hypothetical protein
MKELREVNRQYAPFCHGTGWHESKSIDKHGLKPQEYQQWEDFEIETYPNKIYFASLKTHVGSCISAMDNATTGHWSDGVFYVLEEIPDQYAGLLAVDEDANTMPYWKKKGKVYNALGSLDRIGSFAISFPLVQLSHPFKAVAFNLVDGERTSRIYDEDPEDYEERLQQTIGSIVKNTNWTHEDIDILVNSLTPIAEQYGFEIMIDVHSIKGLDIALIPIKKKPNMDKLLKYLKKEGWKSEKTPSAIQPDHKFDIKEFFYFARKFEMELELYEDWEDFIISDIRERHGLQALQWTEEHEPDLLKNPPQKRIQEIQQIVDRIRGY